MAFCTLQPVFDGLKTTPQLDGIDDRRRERLYAALAQEQRSDWIEALQAGLDAFLANYNKRLPQKAGPCAGKTPLRTFLDGVPLAKEKMLAVEPEQTTP